VRYNYLLQLLFLGKLQFPEGNPFECEPRIFALAKKGALQADITYVHGDIVSEIAKNKNPIDFVSFSDVPSYFSGNMEKTFLLKIRKGLAQNCRVVIRYYLHKAENTDTSGYKDTTQHYREFIKRERTQMYSIQILEKV
jgi:S-adenosylmethionine-diacylglycerol 3-amino-3-carboxypropyl transferase